MNATATAKLFGKWVLKALPSDILGRARVKAKRNRPPGRRFRRRARSVGPSWTTYERITNLPGDGSIATRRSVGRFPNCRRSAVIGVGAVGADGGPKVPVNPSIGRFSVAIWFVVNVGFLL